MIRKSLSILLAVLFSALFLSGCLQQENDTYESNDFTQMILGTWIHYPDFAKGEGAGMSKYTFRSNNSVYFSLIFWDYASGVWIDYEIIGGEIFFSFKVNNTYYNYDYTLVFSENGKNLTLPVAIGEYLANFTKQEPRGIITIEEVTGSMSNIYFGENITVDGYYNSTLNSLVSGNEESPSSLPIDLSKVGISLQEDVLYRFTGLLVSDFSNLFGNHLKLLIEEIEVL